jgi:hypothetical protein
MVKLINLWFDGMLLCNVSLKKEMICDMPHIEINRMNHWIGNLSTNTHKLVYKKGLKGHNYSVERR